MSYQSNKDGYIDAKELKLVTTTLGQRLSTEEVDEFMSTADLDGDGKLNYHEFVKIMTSV
jgi:Ca2+-binding EF-hand superfamily protein